MHKNKKLALNSLTQTYQSLTNDDEVCIQSLSSILMYPVHFAARLAQVADLVVRNQN